MGVLAWLGAPAVATIVAIVWVNWAARPRGPVEIEQSLAERARFNAAFTPPDGSAVEDRMADVESAERSHEARRAS